MAHTPSQISQKLGAAENWPWDVKLLLAWRGRGQSRIVTSKDVVKSGTHLYASLWSLTRTAP